MIFAHENIRPGQKELVETIKKALENKQTVVAHAPTGLGKTAAALSPALELAMNRDVTIFFLTSRHTQHKIVLETVQKIKDRVGKPIVTTSLIGKKWMCAQEVDNMLSSDFSEYCKSLVENDQCHFYTNARGKQNMHALQLLAELKSASPITTEEVIARSKEKQMCPYEMSLMLAEESKVIIADYYYLFHPSIRDTILGKIKKKLGQVVVIVDEAHNLPDRMRDLLTTRLTNKLMRLAIKEAKKYGLDDVITSLVEIQDVLVKLSAVKDERLVKKEEFTSLLNKYKPYKEIVAELDLAQEVVKEDQQVSQIGRVMKFLNEWDSGDEGFARIITKNDMLVTLSVRCLDPSILTKEVFDVCHSAVLMSGTLSPTEMYKDVLGVKDAVSKMFPSPFPEKNRMTLLVPKTTTKYSKRSDQQFERIGSVCAELANSMGGRVMLFFPSYRVRDRVEYHFSQKFEGDVFFEKPGATKVSRSLLLSQFQKRKNAALLGVAAGSFGEGVDLPGVLRGVIVVGLPLGRPDLETTELIAYYDKKFGKGWDYGYTLPAMTKCIQNAGRCIRTENDRGVIAFVDERYAWPRYSKCFPPEWRARVTNNYKEEIAQFFGRLF